MTDEVDVNSHPPLEEEKRQRYYIAKMQQLVKEKETEIGRPLTACVTTFGCQMNARGFREVDWNPEGDWF